MKRVSKTIRVCAIDIFSRGFGYAVMEGERRLVDWGVRTFRRSGDSTLLQYVARCIDLYQPDAVLLEQSETPGSRRGPRAKRLVRIIKQVLGECHLPMCLVEVREVKECIGEDPRASKETVAKHLARDIPELRPHLPPSRKPWMSEDARINLFDATGLAVTFYRKRSQSITLAKKPVPYAIKTTCQDAMRKYLQ